MRVETVYSLALMALYLCKMEMNYINKVQLITVDLDTEGLLLKNFYGMLRTPRFISIFL